MQFLEIEGHGLNVERIARYYVCPVSRYGKPVLFVWFSGVAQPLRLVGDGAAAVLDRIRLGQRFTRLDPPQDVG